MHAKGMSSYAIAKQLNAPTAKFVFLTVYELNIWAQCKNPADWQIGGSGKKRVISSS